MKTPRVYADFHNSDKAGRLRLICKGTIDDLRDNQLQLKEGLSLTFTDGEDFDVEGTVTFSKEEQIWVAVVDWKTRSPHKP
jgi:hypothetical protein